MFVLSSWKTCQQKIVDAGGRRQLFLVNAFFPYLFQDFFKIFFSFIIGKVKIYVWVKFHQLSSVDECFVINWKKGRPLGSTALLSMNQITRRGRPRW